MTPIQILESQGAVFYSDFCRPLSIDAKSATCDSEGYPTNFTKWAPVGLVIPKYFHGLKVESLHQEGYKFEFVRGDSPDDHRLDIRLYPMKPPEVKKPVTKWATANIYTMPKGAQCLM